MLDLISLASDNGIAIVNHNDIRTISNCADSTFYDTLKTLQKFGLIVVNEDDFFKRCIKVTLVENQFLDGFKNYIDTNRIFFIERHYANMTAAMIRVYLYFYKRAYHAKFRNEYRDNKVTYKNIYRHDKAFEAVYKSLCMSKRTFMRALKELNNTAYLSVGFGISITRYNKESIADIVTLAKSYLATPKTKTTKAGGQSIEVSAPSLLTHWEYYVQLLMKKLKKTADESTIHDIAMLFNQYTQIAKSQGKNIYCAIHRAITNADQMEIRAVHSILKKYMAKDFTESFLFIR